MGFSIEACLDKEKREKRIGILRAVRAVETIRFTAASRKALGKRGVSLRRPTDQELKEAYERCVNDLNTRWAKEMTKTSAERVFTKTLGRNTSIAIFTSVWVANRNLDILIPGIGGFANNKGNMQGIAFEINGGIHNSHVKMTKDEHLLNYLSSIRIGLTVIENHEVNSTHAHKVAKGLNNSPKLDSRAKKRVWRRIWLDTVAIHSCPEELVKLFGADILKKKLLNACLGGID